MKKGQVRRERQTVAGEQEVQHLFSHSLVCVCVCVCFSLFKRQLKELAQNKTLVVHTWLTALNQRGLVSLWDNISLDWQIVNQLAVKSLIAALLCAPLSPPQKKKKKQVRLAAWVSPAALLPRPASQSSGRARQNCAAEKKKRSTGQRSDSPPSHTLIKSSHMQQRDKERENISLLSDEGYI